VSVSAQPADLRVERMTDLDVPAVAELTHITQTNVDLDVERQKPYSQIWVARLGPSQKPIAYALAWLVADELQLIDLATHATARRRGAARALVDQLIRHGQSAGARCLLLEVRATNAPALALYRGLGFSHARTRRGYYSDGEDACEMELFWDK
jgi:[ribosomal protein S18]-alanine N-acetyltransferase